MPRAVKQEANPTSSSYFPSSVLLCVSLPRDGLFQVVPEGHARHLAYACGG